MNRCLHLHGERSHPHRPDANDLLAATLSQGGLVLAVHHASPGSPWAAALDREQVRRARAEQPQPNAGN